MQTPPPKKKNPLLSPGDMPTVIAPSPGELPTPTAPNPTVDPNVTNRIKRKLDREFETDPHSEFETDAHSKYLQARIEEANAGLKKQRHDYHQEEQRRLDETANMKLKLPLSKKGGRKSIKRNKKHRKKTSKRRSKK